MTYAAMKKTTKLMPLMRHKRSQNALVFTPVDDVRVASRSRFALPCGVSMIWFTCPLFDQFWIFSGAWTMGTRAIVRVTSYLTEWLESRSQFGRKELRQF